MLLATRIPQEPRGLFAKGQKQARNRTKLSTITFPLEYRKAARPQAPSSPSALDSLLRIKCFFKTAIQILIGHRLRRTAGSWGSFRPEWDFNVMALFAQSVVTALKRDEIRSAKLFRRILTMLSIIRYFSKSVLYSGTDWQKELIFASSVISFDPCFILARIGRKN